MTARRLALFDLDHTLIPIDSDYAWNEFAIARGWVDPVEYKRKNDAFYAQYQAGQLNVHEYVRFSTAAICERGAAQAQQAHDDFMRDVIGPALLPAAFDLIRQHQQAGDQVIIITATNEFVTRPIAKAFGVSELIAVELARDALNNWYTGAIHGVPSFREGKVTRLAQWLTQNGLNWESVHTTFYTDSINDLPLLEKATVPIATNPDARLRAIAAERQWRILDLFPTKL